MFNDRHKIFTNFLRRLVGFKWKTFVIFEVMFPFCQMGILWKCKKIVYQFIARNIEVIYKFFGRNFFFFVKIYFGKIYFGFQICSVIFKLFSNQFISTIFVLFNFFFSQKLF